MVTWVWVNIGSGRDVEILGTPSIEFSSVRSSDLHLRSISQRVVKLLFENNISKIIATSPSGQWINNEKVLSVLLFSYTLVLQVLTGQPLNDILLILNTIINASYESQWNFVEKLKTLLILNEVMLKRSW